MCQDVSCLIICQIEKQMIGIFFADKMSSKILQCVAFAFANDINLMTKGTESFKLIQKILDKWNRLCKGTGSYTQESKTTYFTW